jgi:hypothetical protein
MCADQFRILTCRAPSRAFREHRVAYLAFGLVAAWAAGIGRYWDNPKAETWQRWGVASVVYVPLLAYLLWFLCRPLAAKPLRYSTVITFVAMTSLPALLYAIPVEMLLTPQAARYANAWFLAAVAGWRVVMLVAFLHDVGVRGWALFAGLLYPLVFVVSALAFFNLEHAAFDIMSGVRNTTPYDGAYTVVLVLAVGSCWSFVPLTALYVWQVARTARRRADAAGSSAASPPSDTISR